LPPRCPTPFPPVRGTHLGVREDSGDVETPRALYVHEKGVGALHQTLELMFAEFVGSGGMKQIGRHDQVVARALGSWRKKLWCGVACGGKV